MARGKKMDKEKTGENNPAEATLVADDEAAGATPTTTENKTTIAGDTLPAEVVEGEVTTGDEAVGVDKTQADQAQVSDLVEKLEQARQEAARNLEGWQRAAAELANFKRRQEEQLKLQRDMIKSGVLQGVISALDDMDLAFQNVPADIDGRLIGWVEGFRLVQRKLDKILDEQAVVPVNTTGTFDPNFHEAVSHEESADHKEGEIIAEVRKGYQIGNRVIRPALVRVAK